MCISNLIKIMSFLHKRWGSYICFLILEHAAGETEFQTSFLFLTCLIQSRSYQITSKNLTQCFIFYLINHLKLLNIFFCTHYDLRLHSSVNHIHIPANSLQLLICILHKHLFSHRTQLVMHKINSLRCCDCVIYFCTCHALKLYSSVNCSYVPENLLQLLIFISHEQFLRKNRSCKKNNSVSLS